MELAAGVFELASRGPFTVLLAVEALALLSTWNGDLSVLKRCVVDIFGDKLIKASINPNSRM